MMTMDQLLDRAMAAELGDPRVIPSKILDRLEGLNFRELGADSNFWLMAEGPGDEQAFLSDDGWVTTNDDSWDPMMLRVVCRAFELWTDEKVTEARPTHGE